MLQIQAFKYRLKTNSQSERFFQSQCEACRFVWNKALGMEIEAYAKEKRHLGFAKLCRELTLWKKEKECSFLSSVFSQSLQSSLKDLDRAYSNFFRQVSKRKSWVKDKANFQPPRFKKKGVHDSFRLPDPKTFEVDRVNGRIRIPKLGWVSFISSREILGDIRNATISRDGKHWYISIHTLLEVTTPYHPKAVDMRTGEYNESLSAVGIDLGVANFATLSDGTIYNYNNSLSPLKRLERKLKRTQKSLSRKVKGSQNRLKAKEKLSTLHKKIRDTRSDFLHKVSHEVSKNHALIIMEDLATGNMSKSAKGTRESPGKNVKAKSWLNRSILDQGWRQFRSMLEYKTKREGGILLTVAPNYTSQKCSKCGNIAPENRENQAVFRCKNPDCHHEAHADENAAKNICTAGLAEYAKKSTKSALIRIHACGESVRREDERNLAVSVKQEPTMSIEWLQATSI